MAKTKRTASGGLFEKYRNGIVVESINYDEDKGHFYSLDFAPATITIIIPGDMINDYKKLARTKFVSGYPAANEFVKETGMLENLRKSGVKVKNKNWNTLNDVLDCFKSGRYSAKFQPLESKDVRLEIEEIIPANEAFAA